MQRSGILHTVQHRVTIFDPKVYRAVKPWVGERVTLAVYSARGVWSIPKRLRAYLRRLDFLMSQRSSEKDVSAYIDVDGDGFRLQPNNLDDDDKAILLEEIEAVCVCAECDESLEEPPQA